MDATAENHAARKSGERRDRAFVVKKLPRPENDSYRPASTQAKNAPDKGRIKLRKDLSLPGQRAFRLLKRSSARILQGLKIYFEAADIREQSAADTIGQLEIFFFFHGG